MKKVFIYSGPVHSGKTTSLFQWAVSKPNVKGILQPVIDDKRFLYHISTRELKMLSTKSSRPEEAVSIGNYNFSVNAFSWAQNLLLQDFSTGCEWLIIDEVGPLEFCSKGFEPSLHKIIDSRQDFTGNILFVVRDSLVEQFVDNYQLKNSCLEFVL